MRPVRVVMAKMGLDSHYRGALMVCRHLRARGMEVIYIGNQLPEAIAESVIEEDADVLGLSSLSGNHMVMVPRVLQALRNRGVSVPVMLGGIVPADDAAALMSEGRLSVFGPGSNLDAIAEAVAAAATSEREAVD